MTTFAWSFLGGNSILKCPCLDVMKKLLGPIWLSLNPLVTPPRLHIYKVPEISNYIFTVILAGIIAISIKMIGVLLITGLLLIPPAMSRNFSTSPIQMMFFSIIGGILSVVIGLFCSLELNTPSGPSIIVASLMLFIISLFFKKGMTIVQKSKI